MELKNRVLGYLVGEIDQQPKILEPQMFLVHAYFKMEEERTAVKATFIAAGKGSTKSGNLSSCSRVESKIQMGERILSNFLLEVSVTESKLGSLRYEDSESQGLAVIFKTSQDLEVKLSRMVVFFSLLSFSFSGQLDTS